MKKAKDIMTPSPVCCDRETNLREVAESMVKEDCGEIPVIEPESMRPIGVVTDRDIVCRVVAKGKNPLESTAGECMTAPCVSVQSDTPLDECRWLMEERQIRRIVVTEPSGRICGIVAQADIAQTAAPAVTAEVVKKISEPKAA